MQGLRYFKPEGIGKKCVLLERQTPFGCFDQSCKGSDEDKVQKVLKKCELTGGTSNLKSQACLMLLQVVIKDGWQENPQTEWRFLARNVTYIFQHAMFDYRRVCNMGTV